MSGQDDLAGVMAQLNDLLMPIMEATVGYRESAKRNGFNDEASNRMAADYHAVAMELMKNQAFGSKK